MKYEEWTKSYSEKKQKCLEAEKILQDAHHEFNSFVKETLGVKVGEQIEPSQVAQLVISVLAMSKES